MTSLNGIVYKLIYLQTMLFKNCLETTKIDHNLAKRLQTIAYFKQKV